MCKWVFFFVWYTETCVFYLEFCVCSIDGEIAFLKFHFLLEVIMHNFHIIMSRRKWNFKKAISHSEPLKWGRILILGSKWKFNFLPKMGKNFLCTVYRNLCKWHSFLCSVHRKLICPYFAIGYQLTQPEICREHYFCKKKHTIYRPNHVETLKPNLGP